MKVATQRTFRAVHTWTGLIAGMALFIAFYAGAISVFVHELHNWHLQGELVAADPLDQAQPLVDQLLQQHPTAAEGFSLQLPGHHGPELHALWYDASTATQHKFQLNAAGQLQQSPARADFVSFIYDLHFTAGLPRQAGTYLFGLFCLLYGLALVSGVVIYTPVFLKDLFALRLGPSVKRMWQDAHNLVGVVSLPFHILFAWSGAVLTIGFLMLAPFQFAVFDGKLLQILEPDFEVAPHVEPAGTTRPLVDLQQLLITSQTAMPELEVEGLFYHDAGDLNGTVTLYGSIDSPTVTQSAAVVINTATGLVTKTLTPEQFTPGTSFLRGIQNLHYGNFGDYPVKWLYFVLGMAGAFLFYSGNLLWIESRRKATETQQPRNTRIMASLTLGIALGCMAGVSALFLAGALLPEALHIRCYYLVFFLVLLWSLVRHPSKAAFEMLILTALLTALIPVASFVQSGQHLFNSLWSSHWIRFSVDVTALMMAWCFWRMALAARKRAKKGAENSLWALPAKG